MESKITNNQIQELLRRIENNDLFALGELMEAITPKVSKIAYVILKDTHLAEDVVDEVMIAVVKNIHSFSTKKNINSWINAVTINKSIDYLRKRKNEFLPGDEFLYSIPDKKSEIDIEEKIWVVEVLKKMDPLLRGLLIDKSLNNETIFSLSKKYQLTIKQVRIRLKKAKESFIELYDEKK